MTNDEMRAFVNGLSEIQIEQMARFLAEKQTKQNEMKLACAFSMTARLV